MGENTERPRATVPIPRTPEAREALVLSLLSPKGGYTRAALARIGVPWPPPHHWKRRFIRGWTSAPARARALADLHRRYRHLVDQTD